MKKLMFLITAVCALSLSAAVKLPGIFSDHAVLARNAKVPVFGSADPGEKVTVIFNGQKKITVADRNGKWRVDLNLANSPEGPFELKVNDLVIKDVLVGEVWLCSGQSNMAWVLRNSEGFEEARKNSFSGRLRCFVFKLNSEGKPCSVINDGKWILADADNVGDFSGVGYFFGRKLLKELNTPVGLIRNAWGGSPIEAWMTREAAKVVPAVAVRDAKTSKAFREYPANRKKYIAAHAAWAKRNRRSDRAHKLPPANAKWVKSTRIAYSNSITWIRNTVVSKGGTLPFFMQRQNTPFTVWVDGKKVYEWSLENAVLFRYPRFVIKNIKPGKHEVMFRIYYPLNNRKVLFNTRMTIGETNLDGAKWDVYQEVVFKNRVSKMPRPVGSTPRKFFNTQRLFNGCIYPMLPYAIDGVIWYQGESNANRHKEYAALQRALVMDWRKHFEFADMPFFWCSLAGHRAKVANANQEEAWAYLREAQTAATDIPGTGQVILTDVSETNDIHPRDKVIPGERLAALALARVYGKKVPCNSPAMTKVVREGSKLRITFKDTYGALVARPVPDFYWMVKRNNIKGKLVRNSPNTQLEGFAVCGADGKWVWADEAVIDGETVVVSAKSVPAPVGVRYGWQNNPTCNLFNKAGFPAVPFMKK